MAKTIRRVVTGHDENGRAICVSDAAATDILQRPNRPGVTLTNLWKCDTSPAEYDGSEDTVGGPFILQPPKKAAHFASSNLSPKILK